MAVQLPLNHFVTDLNRQDQTPLEVLEGNISCLKLKSLSLSILEKICYVALLAIIATVFAVSYNLLVLTGATPMVMAGLILASPVLVIAPAKLAQLSRQYESLAEIESGVFLKMREIEQWKAPQIQQFFERHGLNISRLPLDHLRQINPNEPHVALLPLIARFISMEEHIEELRRNFQEAPEKLEVGFRDKEARDGHKIDTAIKQKIRFEGMSSVWAKLELEAIPYAFNAAVLLQLIENPGITDLDVLPMSHVLPGIGVCVPRNYAERMFGKNNQPRNDDYFVFHPDLQRDAITHGTIEQAQMNPDQLRPLLFRNALN